MGMIAPRRPFLFVVSMLFAANAFALTPPLTPKISPTRFTSDGLQTFSLTNFAFQVPLRVFFTGSDGVSSEAYILNVGTTQVTGLTPKIDTHGEERQFTVTIVNRAGMPGESRIDLAARVTFFELDRTLRISNLSPTASPINGGVRLTLFGSGFAAPVQVIVIYPDGSEHEAQVLAVSFNEINFLSPPSTMLGPAGVRVVNVLNGDSLTLANAFRYIEPMSIRSTRPLSGPAAGGTVITIDGSGFSDPVVVSVAGIFASPLRVSGTQIVAVTHAIAPTRCEDVSGPVEVTSVDTGDTAIGPAFTYITPRARFVRLPAELVAGSSGDVTIATLTNPLRFAFHDRVVTPSSVRDNGDGTTTYTLPVPTDLLFRTRRCRRGDGVVALPLTTSLTVSDRVTSCSATEVVVVQPEISSCQSELPGTDKP